MDSMLNSTATIVAWSKGVLTDARSTGRPFYMDQEILLAEMK